MFISTIRFRPGDRGLLQNQIRHLPLLLLGIRHAALSWSSCRRTFCRPWCLGSTCRGILRHGSYRRGEGHIARLASVNSRRSIHVAFILGSHLQKSIFIFVFGFLFYSSPILLLPPLLRIVAQFLRTDLQSHTSPMSISKQIALSVAVMPAGSRCLASLGSFNIGRCVASCFCRKRPPSVPDIATGCSDSRVPDSVFSYLHIYIYL